MDKQYKIFREIDINKCVLNRQLDAMGKINKKMENQKIPFWKFIRLSNQHNYHLEVSTRILDQNKALIAEAKTLIED